MRHPVDDYRVWQPTYAQYDKHEWGPERSKEYLIVGLAAEAAEVLGILQKSLRKDVPISREKIVDELGDTFWYLSGIMNQFNISWKELTEYNMNKLDARNQ